MAELRRVGNKRNKRCGCDGGEGLHVFGVLLNSIVKRNVIAII